MTPEQSKQVIETVNSSAVIIQSMNVEVRRLNTAVLGDDDAGIPGLAGRMEKVEKKVSKHGTFMVKVLAAWSAVCAFVVMFKDKLIG